MGIDIQEKFKQALSFHQQANLEGARHLYEEVIVADPVHANSLHFLGVLSYQEKKLPEALKLIKEAILINPKSAGFYSNLGVVLMELEDYEQAATNYQKAIDLDPNNDNYYYNCGNALQKLEKFESAIKNYQKSIGLNPNNGDYYHNLGDAYKGVNYFEFAIEQYNKSNSINPNYESYLNCGIALSKLKRVDEAIIVINKALELNPQSSCAHDFMGTLLLNNEDFERAEKYLRKSLDLGLDSDVTRGNLLFSCNVMCDWDEYDENCQKIKEEALAGKKTISPFHALSVFDDEQLHYSLSKKHASSNFSTNDSLGEIPQHDKGAKIRIAYYSADFCNHATLYLMSGIFEHHDKSKFEVIAFCFTHDNQDESKQKVMHYFDKFIEVNDMDDKQIAQLSRDMKIDIAIDLKGFTKGTRLDIFSYRCAPIQVSYLGYPGTLGAEFMDYIISDEIVIPEESKKYYQEKVLYMPHSYQCNDRNRKISDKEFTKKQLGLPDDAFVFCCFNKSHKITPDIFDSWMNILKAVPNSVLWIYEMYETVNENIKKQAEKRGVAGSRILFAPNMEMSDNLARQKFADLFLDTSPYNAHTTGSDALWGGLPILTILGNSFASRVGASLVSAVDMPEMIVNSREEYEKKAIEIAQNPQMLKNIKEKLQANRLTTPLFDTKSFTNDLESIYQEIYDQYHSSSKNIKIKNYA